MTASDTEIRTDFFETFDGCSLAVHQCGAPTGKKLLLLHGLFSSAEVNWIKFGTAAHLAASGFELIMPDFRGHGQSDAPHGEEHYPNEIIVSDVREIIEHYIGTDAFDIAGFSLGARTTAKMLLSGTQPGKAAICGMGLEGLMNWQGRVQFFVDAIDQRDQVSRGDKHWFAVQFMKTQKVDPVAARLLLLSFEALDIEAFASIRTPMAIITGTEDEDNGSAETLAERLPAAHYIPIPGNHMNCVTKPEFGHAISSFLLT